MSSRPKLPGFRELFPEYVTKTSQPQTSGQVQTYSTPQSHRGQGDHRLRDANSAARNVDASVAANQCPVNPVHVGQESSSRHRVHSGSNNQTATQVVPVPAQPQANSGGRTHTHDDKRYQCDLCERRFSRPGALGTHMNSHTGAKPFLCDFPGCDKMFSTKSNMRRHSHTHATPVGDVFPPVPTAHHGQGQGYAANIQRRL